MKFSTYTLLISGSAAIKMQSMQEEPVEEQVKCEWKDMACMGVEVPEGQTDMCLILMNEEDCKKGPQTEEATATEEVGVEGEEKPEDNLEDKETQAGAEEEMTKDDQPENIEAEAEHVKKEDDQKPIEEVAGAEDETKQQDEAAKDEKLEEEQTGKEEEMPKEETTEEDK